MTTATIKIAAAYVDVPLPSPPRRRRAAEPDPAGLTLEVASSYCRLWDNTCHNLCGELYSYLRQAITERDGTTDPEGHRP